MITIRNILLFVFLLSLIVSIHEFGHLVAAKIFGVYCSEYSIGFGPKLFSKKGKETEYNIRAIPLGGFVAMAGDTENSLETSVDTTNIPPERTLTGISKWKRIIIMMAGIMMNMLLAWLIYSLIVLYQGQYVNSSLPQIKEVTSDSPAYNAGLKVDDIVTDIEFDNGLSLSPSSYMELISFTSTYDGNGPWHLKVLRNNDKVSIDVTPKYLDSEDRYIIGIVFSDAAVDVVKVNILNCWYYGLKYLIFMVKLTVSSLVSLFKGYNLNSLSGPIGIYSTVSEAVKLGFMYYVELIAIISLNVGIMNALPLPIFDGGRVLLLIIEAIIGKPLSQKATNLIMTMSLVLLMMLLFFTTYNDIFKLIGG